MNDKALETMLTRADECAGEPCAPSQHLAQMTRAVYARRRRRRKNYLTATAFGAAYCAGLLTMWPMVGPSSQGSPHVAQKGAVTEPSSSPQQRHAPQEDNENSVAPQPDPHTEPPARISKYVLLRRLGDACHRRGDLETATTYYSEALDAASDAECQVAYDRDSWLLISLKQDRLLDRNLQGTSS